MTSRQPVVVTAFALVCLLWAAPAHATNYKVKADGTGDFRTIQECATVAVSGDMCTVYAGAYAEKVTVPRSGAPGSPITFQAYPGDTVVVTAFDIRDRTYITISGFEIDNGYGHGITGGASHNAIIENNYIHSYGGNCIRLPDSSPSNDTVIRGNKAYHCGWGNGGTGSAGINAYGDRMLIENNDVSHSADFLYVGGVNVVIRNNRLHDASHDELPGSSEHIDGIQVSGVTLKYSLVEGNVFQGCRDSTRQCHFLIIRNQSAPAADTVIVRYNFIQAVDGSGATFGGIGDSVPNARFYNNTCATEHLLAENQLCASFQNAPAGVAKNNISYNSQVGGWYPWGGAERSGNLAFVSGYSDGWPSEYSSEPTYAALSNRNPLFAEYPSSGRLQVASPARQAGVELTTVAAGDSGAGVTLAVRDSRYFQPGWANVSPDWIRVGTSAAVQVASIDYAANTLTLRSPVNRAPGDPVYLHKDSDGSTVFYGSQPDVGAFPYSVPAPPSAPLIIR